VDEKAEVCINLNRLPHEQKLVRLCGYSNQYQSMVENPATYLVTPAKSTGITAFPYTYTCFWNWFNLMNR